MGTLQLRMEKGGLTIYEGVDDELPVLLDQVVNVSKNSAVATLSARRLSRCSKLLPSKVRGSELTTWRASEKMV
jgi:hypothetical protein